MEGKILKFLRSVVSRESAKKRLIIFDDVFPNILSAFRVAEFNYYFKEIKNTSVYSTTPNFQKHYNDYIKYNSNFARESVKEFQDDYNYESLLYYFVFLNNANSFMPIVNQFKKSFVFSLYPGGGFFLDQPDSDEKLKRVLGSGFFRKVIATQNIAYEYMLQKGFCTADQVELIYGGIIPPNNFNKNFEQKKFYKVNKNTLDICFVAAKYMDKGKDKGYDVFVKVAHKLSSLKDVRFHVIGGFTENDIDVSHIGDKIRFYGYQPTHSIEKIYQSMDIILSPNRANTLWPGAFDGFPTGCGAEAGLNAVALFCTDCLGLNKDLTTGLPIYRDGEEICIIPTDEKYIAEKVEYYYHNPIELQMLALKGARRLAAVLDYNDQMQKRMAVIAPYL